VRLGVEQNAVVILALFKGAANADSNYITPLELSNCQIEPRGQGVDFLLVYPHITRRPRAAIAALGAFESQSFGVPGF
jgi:hypothetical protein